jgi:ABC-type transport system substrate-binding protein
MHRRLVAVIALSLLSLMTACGAEGTSGGNSSPDVLRVATATPIKTLNLARTTEFPPMAISSLFGGTLTVLDSSSEPVGGLAETFGVSPDGLVYTFSLRSKLKFSDGSDLRADHVVATFESLMADQANVNASDFATWRSVEAPDDLTVVIELSAPTPALPVLLSAPWNAIYPSNALDEANSFFEQPVSAGPYRVTEIAPGGQRVTLDLNEYYYGEEPSIGQVEFTTVPDENTRILQLKGDQVDIATELDPASISQFAGNNQAVGEVIPLAGMYYIWMSNRDGPLAEVDVRRAIGAAVDRDQINEVVWAGLNEPVGALLPPGVEGHEENVPTERDLDLAKELLEGTACKSGCELGMIVRNGRPIDAKSALVIKENLADIGIEVTIEPLENGVASEREASGDFDMEVEWLGLPVPDTSTYLKYAVISDGGIEALFSGYSSVEMDAAAKALATATGDQRGQLLDEINQLFAEDLPYVPLQPWALVVGVRQEIRDSVDFTFAGYVQVKRAESS